MVRRWRGPPRQLRRHKFIRYWPRSGSQRYDWISRCAASISLGRGLQQFQAIPLSRFVPQRPLSRRREVNGALERQSLGAMCGHPAYIRQARGFEPRLDFVAAIFEEWWEGKVLAQSVDTFVAGESGAVCG